MLLPQAATERALAPPKQCGVEAAGSTKLEVLEHPAQMKHCSQPLVLYLTALTRPCNTRAAQLRKGGAALHVSR